MKNILLPSQHVIFDYFPDMEKENKSFSSFKEEVSKKLKDIYNASDKFFLQRKVLSNEHINWRYPLMTPFFIKSYITDKNVLHVGSRGGEIDEGIGYYAKSLISVEMERGWYQSNLNRSIQCERKLINATSHELSPTDIKDIETCYTYTTYIEDVAIVKDLYSKNSSITFLVGLAQQEDKLKPLLQDLKNFSEEKNLKIDYVPILFDESVGYYKKYDDDKMIHEKLTFPQYPVTRDTLFTNLRNNEWNSTENFGDQWGVMLLLKIN